jgi:hypothetical protein
MFIILTFIANVGILKDETRDAATASFVERGLLAVKTTSAPPAFKVSARFAVSAVT